MCIGSEGVSPQRPTDPDSIPVKNRDPLRGFVVLNQASQPQPSRLQRRAERPMALREARAS